MIPQHLCIFYVQYQIKQMISKNILHNSHKDLIGILEFYLIFFRDISLGHASAYPEHFHGLQPISDLDLPSLKVRTRKLFWPQRIGETSHR
jgi:hypothetical protein